MTRGKSDGGPPVKLYYRIGEVAEIVGVEPHVLRYWETEFRTIRPQKSRKGQRIYSRKDVERLMRVKDLLYTQGYTIAGARRRLRERSTNTSSASTEASPNPRLRAQLEELRAEVTRMLEELGGTAPARRRGSQH